MCRLLFVLALITASSAFAQRQATAYEALRVVGTQFNRAAIRRVISVTGDDGDPQPVTWRVLIADRSVRAGVRELQVANSRIVADRTPTESVNTHATIETAKLNLDSSGAFTVASYTADKSHTNFDRVSYTLRTNQRGVPTWTVTLQDHSRHPLGTIYIGANRGNVTRVEGLYRGADMAQVEQDPVPSRGNDEGMRSEDVLPDEETDRDENIVKARIKQMFRRTKRDAEQMFQRVTRSFDRYFYRN